MNGTGKTKILGIFGHYKFAHNGGSVVCDGDHGPYVLHFELCEDREGSDVMVYCFHIDCPMDLITNDDDLARLASYTGRSEENLIDVAHSSEPLDRAVFYVDYGTYYGMTNLDESPRRMSRDDAYRLVSPDFRTPSKGEPV